LSVKRLGARFLQALSTLDLALLSHPLPAVRDHQREKMDEVAGDHDEYEFGTGIFGTGAELTRVGCAIPRRSDHAHNADYENLPVLRAVFPPEPHLGYARRVRKVHAGVVSRKTLTKPYLTPSSSASRLARARSGTGFVQTLERGLVVTLPTSKSSQDEAVEIVIPCPNMPTASCASMSLAPFGEVRIACEPIHMSRERDAKGAP